MHPTTGPRPLLSFAERGSLAQRKEVRQTRRWVTKTRISVTVYSDPDAAKPGCRHAGDIDLSVLGIGSTAKSGVLTQCSLSGLTGVV